MDSRLPAPRSEPGVRAGRTGLARAHLLCRAGRLTSASGRLAGARTTAGRPAPIRCSAIGPSGCGTANLAASASSRLQCLRNLLTPSVQEGAGSRGGDLGALDLRPALPGRRAASWRGWWCNSRYASRAATHMSQATPSCWSSLPSRTCIDANSGSPIPRAARQGAALAPSSPFLATARGPAGRPPEGKPATARRAPSATAHTSGPARWG